MTVDNIERDDDCVDNIQRDGDILVHSAVIFYFGIL